MIRERYLLRVNGFGKLLFYKKTLGIYAPTGTTLATAFAKAFNTDPNSPVTATSFHNVVTLTAKGSGAGSNNHTVAMEAFLVTVKHPSAEKLTMGPVFYDVYTNYRRDQPISPGAQHQIALPVLRGQEPPVATLQAAIFADGSSWGDPARVQEILHARQVLSDRLSEVSALLQTIAQQKPTREQALAAIQTAWDAKKKATPNLPIATADEIDEIEAVDASEESTRTAQVYYHVISNLQRNPAAVRDSTDVTKFLLRMSGTLSHWNAEIQAAKPLLGNPK